MNPEEDDIERYEEQREPLELSRDRDIVTMFDLRPPVGRAGAILPREHVEMNQREDGWFEWCSATPGSGTVPPGPPRVERRVLTRPT